MSTITDNIKYISEKFIVYSDKIIYRKEVDKVDAENILNRLGYQLNGPLIKAFGKEWEQSIIGVRDGNEC